MKAYNEAIANANRPQSGKFADLMALYKKSAEFTTRSVKTQKDYLRYIKLIETKFGTMPISALGAPARSRRVQRLEARTCAHWLTSCRLCLDRSATDSVGCERPQQNKNQPMKAAQTQKESDIEMATGIML